MKKVYLAGALEFATNTDWWYELRDELQRFDIKAIIPFDVDNVSERLEDQFEKTKLDKMSYAHGITVAKIVKRDLELVESSDAILVRYTKCVRLGAGVHGEITVGRYLKKPIVIWVDNYNAQDIPSWIFGCTKHIIENKMLALQKLYNILGVENAIHPN